MTKARPRRKRWRTSPPKACRRQRNPPTLKLWRTSPPKPRRRRTSHEEVSGDRRAGVASVFLLAAGLRHRRRLPRDERHDLLCHRQFLKLAERAEGAGPSVPLHQLLFLDLQPLRG